ncbi:MAG: HEPN domain-containing protein [Actinomycetota bacterium]
MTDEPLRASDEELAAARHLVEGGFMPQAVSRAYYAAFRAAEAALGVVGETRSKHAGVISAFVRHVVKAGGLDEETGRILRSLFERRNLADYVPIEVPPAEAASAIQDAERFVAAVAAWLAEPRRIDG